MVKYVNRVDCNSCGKSIEFSLSEKKHVHYAYRGGKIRWYCTKCFNKINKHLKGSIELEPLTITEFTQEFVDEVNEALDELYPNRKLSPKEKNVKYWKKIARSVDNG